MEFKPNYKWVVYWHDQLINSRVNGTTKGVLVVGKKEEVNTYRQAQCLAQMAMDWWPGLTVHIVPAEDAPKTIRRIKPRPAAGL